MGDETFIRKGTQTWRGIKSPTAETLWISTDSHVGQTLLTVRTFKGSVEFLQPDPFATKKEDDGLRLIRIVEYTFTGFDSTNNLHLQRTEESRDAAISIHSKQSIVIRLNAEQKVSVKLFAATESDDPLLVEVELQVVDLSLHAKYIGDMPRLEPK